MERFNRELLPYMLGALLYTPAITKGIADKLENNAFPSLRAMAFCLEDSIQDDALESAEKELKNTLAEIREKNIDESKLPLIFVRIRTPQHMQHVHELLGEEENIITGYILPKFDLSNAKKYAELIRRFNLHRKETLYIMPILESRMIADISFRKEILLQLRAVLDGIKSYVLNVRVGGNDFSNLYGLRRSVTQNIFEVGVIRDILVDIINIFGSEYVVSGPVWEYFGEDPDGEWAKGLKRELELELLNGFIGKTAIHPAQLPVICESLKVSKDDYEDAKEIIFWSKTDYGVAKSKNGSRMNEVKCHTKWAERIYRRGQAYGILED